MNHLRKEEELSHPSKKIAKQGMLKVRKAISRPQEKHIAGKQLEYFIIELVNRRSTQNSEKHDQEPINCT